MAAETHDELRGGLSRSLILLPPIVLLFILVVIVAFWSWLELPHGYFFVIHFFITLLVLNFAAGNPSLRIYKAKTAEESIWRWRRILFRAIVAFTLTPAILYFGSNLIIFGRLTFPSIADFVPQVQPLIPIVRAIKEYKRDTGRFPDKLLDLVPKYYPRKIEVPGIRYESGYLVRFATWNHMIEYNFGPQNEGWWVGGPFVSGWLPLPPVTIDGGESR